LRSEGQGYVLTPILILQVQLGNIDGGLTLAQAGLELLTLSDPPASASQSARITGVSHRARPF
uniref:Uncharacterized protein n=1 Tax=Prolemur simus TaxID=1328070 RepID=A0A8C9AEB3_PROSS